jgi:hypothetical protein
MRSLGLDEKGMVGEGRGAGRSGRGGAGDRKTCEVEAWSSSLFFRFWIHLIDKHYVSKTYELNSLDLAIIEMNKDPNHNLRKSAWTRQPQSYFVISQIHVSLPLRRPLSQTSNKTRLHK